MSDTQTTLPATPTAVAPAPNNGAVVPANGAAPAAPIRIVEASPIPVHPVSLDPVQPAPQAAPGTTPPQPIPAGVPVQQQAPQEAKKGLFGGLIDKVKQIVDDHPVATAATAAAITGVVAGQRMERNQGQRGYGGTSVEQAPQQDAPQGNHGPGWRRQ